MNFYLKQNNSFQEVNCLDNPSIQKRANDTLASGVVVVLNNTYIPYEEGIEAKLKYENNAEDLFLVANDNVEIFSKESALYKHNITLIEQTKVLEKIFIPAMTFTGKDYASLYHEINRAISNIEVIYGSYDILVDSSITDFINAESEDFNFSNCTARELFDEMLSSQSCRVMATKSGNTITLKAFNLNNVQSASIIGSIVGVYSSNNIDTKGGKIVSCVSNALTPNYIRQVDTFKCKTTTASVNDYQICLSYGIDHIKSIKFLVSGDVTFTGWFEDMGTGSSDQHTATKDMSGTWFDMTKYFVDKEYWDTLADSDPVYSNQSWSVTRRNTLYYERGSADINVSGTYKKIITTQQYIDKAIQCCLHEWAYLHKTEIKYQGHNLYALVGNNPIGNITDSKTKVAFDIEYKAYIDSVVFINKEKSNNDLVLIDNQSANIVDLERLGGNLQGKIKRLGNTELIMDVITSNYADILSVLSEITFNGYKYVIYQVDYARVQDVNSFYQVRYYMTKGFNNLNEKVGIKREHRIYEVPLVGYKTIIPKFLKVNFSKVPQTPTNDGELCTNIASQLMGNKYDKIITNCLCSVDNGTLLNEFNIPTITYASGNSLNVEAKFYDNFSAGLSVQYTNDSFIQILDWVGGKKVLYNPYVYTNNANVKDGYATNFNCRFGKFSQRTINGLKMQPLLNTSEVNAYFSNVLKLTNSGTFNYNWLKDSAESIILKLIYSIESADNDIVVGNKIVSDSSLINGANTQTLYVYSGGNIYQSGDTKVNSNAIQVGLASSILSIRNNEHTGTSGICAFGLRESGTYTNLAIGDADKNLYVAINREITRNTFIYIYEKI